MTREEAKEILSRPFNMKNVPQDILEAHRMAIKALEQEPVIDKIRAEIEQLTITEGGGDYVRKMAELFSLKMKVLHIIDKYKAEK